MQPPDLSDSLSRTLFRPSLPEYHLTLEESAVLSQKKAVFERLTASFSIEAAKEASHDYTSVIQEDSTLTYGEVGKGYAEFESLGEVLESIKGSGKAILSAALLHPLCHCHGIELVPSLHAISLQIKEVYDRAFPAERQASPQLFPAQPELSFTLGSFFDVNWSDAALFFANSTCFSREMMQKIADTEVADGTIGITLTKPLQGARWQLLESYKKNMSWGYATVFVQRRVSEELI